MGLLPVAYLSSFKITETTSLTCEDHTFLIKDANCKENAFRLILQTK